MDKVNMNALAQRMVGAVKVHTARAQSAVTSRIAVLEKEVAGCARGRELSDDPEFLRSVSERVRAGIREPEDGKDADMDALRQAALAEVNKLVDAIPKPKDGASVDETTVKRMVEAEVEACVAALPKPRDGKDVDYAAVRGHILEIVNQAVAALPAPRDGRDAAELDILPSLDENKSYRRGTWARHANGLLRAARQTDALADKSVTEAGWDVIVEGVAALLVTQGEDPRAIEVASMLTSGTKAIVAFNIPMVLDRGVYRAETKYAKGDGVTWGGSWWIAQVDEPTDKPGVSAQWRLAVKQGERGKSARDDSAPKPGPIKLK